MLIMEQICKLINENLELNVDAADIGADDSLVPLGMDSISFIKLIVAIEREFDIEVDDEYLLINRLDTKGKLNELLERVVKNVTK